MIPIGRGFDLIALQRTLFSCKMYQSGILDSSPSGPVVHNNPFNRTYIFVHILLIASPHSQPAIPIVEISSPASSPRPPSTPGNLPHRLRRLTHLLRPLPHALRHRSSRLFRLFQHLFRSRLLFRQRVPQLLLQIRDFNRLDVFLLDDFEFEPRPVCDLVGEERG
jgi:hypothetical protein